MQTKRVDHDANLSSLIDLRHDPDAPNSAEIQAQDERRRLQRRERDERAKNRYLWQDHYLRLAENLRRRADEYESKARQLAPGEGRS